MKIKKGDKVQIMKGKDRGKSAKVLRMVEGGVVVEGLNLFKKTKRARKQGEKGQLVSVPHPVNISNVSIICPSCGKPTRIGMKVEKGNKTRFCKKCNATI